MASNWNQQPQAPPGYPPVGGQQGYPGQQEYPGGGYAWGAPDDEKKAAGGNYPGMPQQQQFGGSTYPGAGAPPPGPMMPPPHPVVDPEAQAYESDMAFATVAMRNAFVRKVFGIVTLQLLFTVGISAMCIFVPAVKGFVRQNPALYYVAWGVAFALVLVISCVPSARTKFPLNLILLSLFTLAEAFLVGMITAFHDIEAVMLAFLVTCAAVAALTIFAMNTKIDVTKWGSMLGVLMIVLLVLILVGLFFPFRGNKILYLAISGFAALLFSAYLIYDIQLIMGGKSYSYSPDDYVAAALSVYLDVINLFIAILSIIGLSSNN